MTQIAIFCDGGFGNRLNILYSGLALARLCHFQPTIYWPRNNWCQAALSDIFSNSWEVSETLLSELAGKLDGYVALLHDQMGADTLRVPFQSAYAFASLDVFVSEVQQAGKPIFYYPALIPNWIAPDAIAQEMKACHFVAGIRQQVLECLSHIGRPFYGLHLRRTDLNVGYSDSEVQAIVRAHPEQVFFVCSDDPLAEALAAVHPNVHCRRKVAYVGKRQAAGGWNALTADDDGRVYSSNIDRNAASVIDAVIDMLVLAHSEIVGFSGSTFQNMARLIGVQAPLLAMARPQQAIEYLSLGNAERMVRNGALSAGDCVGQALKLHAEGRVDDAIRLQKIALEHAVVQGLRDVNVLVLHYNLAVHLLNASQPYEATVYLERASVFFPDNAQIQELLKMARQRCALPDTAAPAGGRAHTGSGLQKIVRTYMQWHLGDNLIHLHFLRKLAEKYPEIEFHHALNPAYLGQCQDVVSDIPRIHLEALAADKPFQGIDAWKGADGFFFQHPKKLQFGALYLDLFAKMAREMGLSSPFRTTSDLLFDYPAIQKDRGFPQYDVLLINSVPLSDQFKSYRDEDFSALAMALWERGLSVVTTKRMDGFACTLDNNMTVTDIANLSLSAKYLIAVCTGAMWPSINVFNQDRHAFKLILNDHETVDIGRNIVMCTDSGSMKKMAFALMDQAK